MIDLTQETPIALRDAREHRLLRGLGTKGKPPSVSTLERWATTGVGGIVLETINVVKGMATTEESIIRFFERLTHPHIKDTQKTPNAARKAHEAAAAMLDKIGV